MTAPLYQSDEHGRYAVRAEWVDAWADRAPGWCICEARQYEDGPIRIHRGPPRYVSGETRELASIHAIFVVADKRLKWTPA